MAGILIAIIIVLAGGGTTIAAQSAKPGDLLFGIKTQINERVEVALAGSAANKAKVNAKLAERRLSEAEEVIVEGELSAKVRGRIEENFKSHAERVRTRIDTFKEKDLDTATDILVNFETSLEVHQRILAELGAQIASDAEKKEIEDLDDDIDDQEEKTERRRMDAEAETAAKASPAVQASAEGKLRAAENKIAEARAFIDLRQDASLSGTVADARQRLAIAEQAVADGRAKLAASAYADAFALFSDAHRIAQEAKLLLEIEKGFKGDLDLRLEVHGLGEEISSDANEPSDESTDDDEDRNGVADEENGSDKEGRQDDDIEAETEAESRTNVNDQGADVDLKINANLNIRD